MSSSSSTGKKSNKVMIVMAAVLLVVSLRTRSASADVSWLCNPALFDYDDPRIPSAHGLLGTMVGNDDPVLKGAWYDHAQTFDNKIVYGYRRVDDIEGAGSCISEAMYALISNPHCYQHSGGQAWGDGCLLRYEAYPFQV
ncbi:unnamed protein product [Linum trigynum]|uniref:Gnk2-homologous domain-containing protein n=1 Tax=Linum trigynum TaxID=586398 RepID=A0AAV2GB69_9ROSI